MISHSSKIQMLAVAVLAVAMYVFATAIPAHADGTHGCQTKITNSKDKEIIVYTYNSDDAICADHHKKYYISEGETKTVKAHSQGENYCKLSIRMKQLLGPFKLLCKNSECPPGLNISKTAGKKTSFEVKGADNCPGLKGF